MKSIYRTGAHGPTNAIVALGLGVYIAVLVTRGNLGPFWQALQSDIITSGFWKWVLALVILYYLASNPSLNPVFGPLLIIAVIAMLIYAAEKNPASLQNLRSGINSLFGSTTANG